jgi:hypothetical protein
MTTLSSDRPREASVGAITVGLLLWFIVSSLAVGFVATHADSASVQRLLDGLEQASAKLGPTYTD